MGARFKKEVAALSVALNADDAKQEATELLRGLIDKIVLTPKPNIGEYSIDLHGDLAGILSLAAGNKTSARPILKQFEDLDEYDEEIDTLIRENSVTQSFQISESCMQGIGGCGSRI